MLERKWGTLATSWSCLLSTYVSSPETVRCRTPWSLSSRSYHPHRAWPVWVSCAALCSVAPCSAALDSCPCCVVVTCDALWCLIPGDDAAFCVVSSAADVVHPTHHPRICAGEIVSLSFLTRPIFASYSLEHRLVQLQLIEQIQIGAWFGHITLYDSLHALLLQQIALIVETILIGQPCESFIDQRCGIDD